MLTGTEASEVIGFRKSSTQKRKKSTQGGNNSMATTQKKANETKKEVSFLKTAVSMEKYFILTFLKMKCVQNDEKTVGWWVLSHVVILSQGRRGVIASEFDIPDII